MAQNQIKPVSFKEIDIHYYLSHYINLIWRYKWYILLSGPVVTIAWMVYILKFGTIKPELDAAAYIGLENTSDISAVRDVSSTGQGKIELIKSRNFLGDIVDELSLRLMVSKQSRSDIFDSLCVDSTAAMGRYEFNLAKDDKEYYTLSYWNRQFGFENKLLRRGRLVTLDTMLLPGMYLKFNGSFLKNPKPTTFFIVRQRDAVEWLKKNLRIQVSGSQSGYVTIIIKGKDYKLITVGLNTIANRFVENNLNFRKRKTIEVIHILEKQLQTASNQLSISQNAVRVFRESNPGIGLGQESQKIISDLTQLQANSFSVQSLIEEVKLIETKLDQSQNEDIETAIKEAFIFLTSHNNPSATALQNDYLQLLQKRVSLQTNYAKTHPLVIENQKKIELISGKVRALLALYENTLGEEKNDFNYSITGINQKMMKLPSQEMELAQLEQQQEVNSQIYSNILTRYNQAKIADAVEVADVFVMDYAVVPEAPPDFINVLVRIGIGLLIGFMVSFSIPVLLDLFDKKVRTENELKKILQYPFLGSIPVIKSNELLDKNDKIKNNKKAVVLSDPQKNLTLNSKLITAVYAQNYVNELFRSTRAKLSLKLHDFPCKKFVVTSFNMSDGKSLIASNIAITFAQQKLKTVLIDGDIRRGILHKSFSIEKSPGLSDLLSQEDSIDNLSIDKIIHATEVENLSLICTGPNVHNPGELLSSKNFKDLMEFLSSKYEVIIMDTAPLGPASDAALLGDFFQGYVLIVKAGVTNCMFLKDKIEEYSSVRKAIIGLILNNVTIDQKLKYYRSKLYKY